MWKRCERQVEVVGQFPILQFFWLQQRVPDTLQVGSQRCLEVREGRRSDVIANNK